MRPATSPVRFSPSTAASRWCEGPPAEQRPDLWVRQNRPLVRKAPHQCSPLYAQCLPDVRGIEQPEVVPLRTRPSWRSRTRSADSGVACGVRSQAGRDRARAQLVADEIRQLPEAPAAVSLEADVGDEAAVMAAAAEVDAAWGRVDALVINAGWMWSRPQASRTSRIGSCADAPFFGLSSSPLGASTEHLVWDSTPPPTSGSRHAWRSRTSTSTLPEPALDPEASGASATCTMSRATPSATCATSSSHARIATRDHLVSHHVELRGVLARRCHRKVLAAHDESAGTGRIAALRQRLPKGDRWKPLGFQVASALTPHLTAVHMTWGAVNEWTTQAAYAVWPSSPTTRRSPHCSAGS